MKKEKMITRTIVTTVANVTFVNVDDNSIETREFKYVGKIGSKEIVDRFNNEFKPVAVAFKAEIIAVNETLFGVPESEFLKIAQVLPPRTKTEE